MNELHTPADFECAGPSRAELLQFERLLAELSVRFINLPAARVDDAISDAHSWPDELVERVGVVATIFGNALAHKRVREALDAAIDFEQTAFEVLAALLTSALNEQDRVIDLRARYESLTPRDREVFVLVAAGLLNKVIADRLGAAESTVKIHRGRVMEKMRAASSADLVRMAEHLGLLRTVVPEGPNSRHVAH